MIVSIDKPGGREWLLADLRRRLREAGRGGLRLPAESAEGRVADELITAGEAVRRRGRLLTPEAAGLLRGVLEGPSGGGDDDGLWRLRGGQPAWVPVSRAGGAAAGAEVLAQPLAGRRRRFAGEALPEAKVVAVVERVEAPLVGRLDGDGRWYSFFSKAPTPTAAVDALPRERWIEVVQGDAGAQVRHSFPEGADEAVVIAAADLREAFPRAAIEQADALPGEPTAADLADRTDLRGLHTFTIDGASTRDFDDALSLEPRSAGGWRLGVHIADVSHYVAEGSALDLEAYRRGTSVYFPGRVVPMFPPSLSDGLCSLQPERDRLTLSLFLEVDAAGAVTAAEAVPAVIRSRRRWTYDEVQAVLDSPAEGEEADLLRALARLAQQRRQRRRDRGALDFDSPLAELDVDAAGAAVAVSERARNQAHRIVEEAMLMANEAVARVFTEGGDPREDFAGGLFRSHPAPRPEALEELQVALAALGLSLAAPEPGPPPPAAFAELLEAAAETPHEELVAALVVRSLGQATYRCDATSHFALAAPAYTHFTSPIRRYPDLVVHRCLRQGIAGRGLSRDLRQRLPHIARHCSERERRAERAERSLRQWKVVRLLADHLGDTFAGRVTGVERYGVFVELETYRVAGLIPVSALGSEFFTFDEEKGFLEGSRSGRRFSLGDRLEATLTAVDEVRRGLVLRLREPRRRRRSRRR